jgi:hypothetical protein
MKELKSKKTGKTTIYSEEEYAEIVHHKPQWLKRFDVTDMRGTRQIIPQDIPKEIKVTKITKK